MNVLRSAKPPIFAALLFFALSASAYAQNWFPTPSGATVPGQIGMCLNSSGNAVPTFNLSGSYECAGGGTPQKSGVYASAGSGQYGLTVASATTLTVPTGATIAEICVETQGVRYKDDGGTPTSSSGIPVPSGTCFQYAGPLSAIEFIQQSSSATLDVSYYK